MKINTFLRNTARLILALIIAATTFMFHTPGALAWEQGANGSHEEINKYAVNRFLSGSASNPKYASSPIDTKQTFWGNQTISATLNSTEFDMKESSLTFAEWVAHGGFSADEPEIWACVRHFYDPLAINGVPQLTDHLALHGFVYTTISAKDWAFQEAVNPYGWRKALEYYKFAMGLSDDTQITVVKGIDFRDTDILVNSAAEARSVYLGKAYRALGETMHMMADITQPAHVRNDSHPSINTDPLESTVNKDTVRLVKDSPVDPEIGKQIESAADLEDMYEKISLYTNANFYTFDTIYDKASGVLPRNWENPYPHPQFSDLKVGEGALTKMYYRVFNGKKVPMVYRTYTSSKVAGSEERYILPPSFATEQAEVLIPIAIKANAKVIDSFFPTFDLTLDVKQNSAASTNGDPNYREYALETQLKHLIDNDVEWKKSNLEIKYSGPGELWGETKGKASKIADLKFKNGLPVNPQTVFVGDEKYQNADKHLVGNVDKIYILIKAGGRTITSKKFSMPVLLSISPLTLTGELNKEYTFTAKTSNPPAKALYTWTLNGAQAQSSTSNTFKTKFTAADNYQIGVKLISGDGKEMASATASVVIEGASPTPSASPTPDIEVDSPTPSASTPTAPNNLPYLLLSNKLTGRVSGLMNYDIFKDGTTTNIHDYDGGFGWEIPITWSGTSFSGKTHDVWGEKGAAHGESTSEISGTVSADGNTLLTLTYSYADVSYLYYSYTEADSQRWTKSISLQNMPLDQGRVDGYRPLYFTSYGSDAQKCIVSIAEHNTSIENGKKKFEETYLSHDWSAMDTNSDDVAIQDWIKYKLEVTFYDVEP
jgi:hypothetical protein